MKKKFLWNFFEKYFSWNFFDKDQKIKIFYIDQKLSLILLGLMILVKIRKNSSDEWGVGRTVTLIVMEIKTQNTGAKSKTRWLYSKTVFWTSLNALTPQTEKIMLNKLWKSTKSFPKIDVVLTKLTDSTHIWIIKERFFRLYQIFH